MSDQSPLPRAPRPPTVLIGLVGVCAILETVLTLLALPPIQSTALRETAFLHGAFWPGLLADWQPLFAGQRMTMFITHAFVHGGFFHMLFNMLILLHLGREAVARLGAFGFLLTFVLCAIAGAALYGLLAPTNAPMVGASGAVFGFFGTNMYWQYQRQVYLRQHAPRLSGKSPLREMIDLMIGLAIMNLVLYFLVDGALAWQAHLGGFVAGAVLARFLTPTLHHRWRPNRTQR